MRVYKEFGSNLKFLALLMRGGTLRSLARSMNRTERTVLRVIRYLEGIGMPLRKPRRRPPEAQMYELEAEAFMEWLRKR